MERAAEASGGAGAPQLQFHNLVNNADVVPRLLGTSLESLHDILEAYIPMIQVPEGLSCAQQYHQGIRQVEHVAPTHITVLVQEVSSQGRLRA